MVKVTYRYRFKGHTMVGAHRVNFEAFRFCKEKGFTFRFYVFHDQEQI